MIAWLDDLMFRLRHRREIAALTSAWYDHGGEWPSGQPMSVEDMTGGPVKVWPQLLRAAWRRVWRW